MQLSVAGRSDSSTDKSDARRGIRSEKQRPECVAINVGDWRHPVPLLASRWTARLGTRAGSPASPRTFGSMAFLQSRDFSSRGVGSGARGFAMTTWLEAVRILPGVVGMPDRHGVRHRPDRRLDPGRFGPLSLPSCRVRLFEYVLGNSSAVVAAHHDLSGTPRWSPLVGVMERFALELPSGGVVLHRHCRSRRNRPTTSPVAYSRHY